MTRMGGQNIETKDSGHLHSFPSCFSGHATVGEIRKTEKSVTRPWPPSLAVSNYSILLTSLASEYD